MANISTLYEFLFSMTGKHSETKAYLN